MIKFSIHYWLINRIFTLQNLPKIIQDSGEVGEFEIDIFNVKINKIETYEKGLIKLQYKLVRKQNKKL